MADTKHEDETESEKAQQDETDIALATDKLGPAIGFRPANFDELWRFSSMIARTDMVPRDFQNNPGKILAAVQMGFEVGLPPMQGSLDKVQRPHVDAKG